MLKILLFYIFKWVENRIGLIQKKLGRYLHICRGDKYCFFLKAAYIFSSTNSTFRRDYSAKICIYIYLPSACWFIKRTGTRDLIWLKVVGIIGKVLMSRAHGRPLKFFKVFLYNFNYYFKKLSGTGKNYAYCKCE